MIMNIREVSVLDLTIYKSEVEAYLVEADHEETFDEWHQTRKDIFKSNPEYYHFYAAFKKDKLQGFVSFALNHIGTSTNVIHIYDLWARKSKSFRTVTRLMKKVTDYMNEWQVYTLIAAMAPNLQRMKQYTQCGWKIRGIDLIMDGREFQKKYKKFFGEPINGA